MLSGENFMLEAEAGQTLLPENLGEGELEKRDNNGTNGERIAS